VQQTGTCPQWRIVVQRLPDSLTHFLRTQHNPVFFRINQMHLKEWRRLFMTPNWSPLKEHICLIQQPDYVQLLATAGWIEHCLIGWLWFNSIFSTRLYCASNTYCNFLINATLQKCVCYNANSTTRTHAVNVFPLHHYFHFNGHFQGQLESARSPLI